MEGAAETVVSNLDPPKKSGWFMRVVRKCTPKKWHKYYTPEVVAAWNISSLATDVKWLGILAVPWDAVTPVLRVYWSNIVAGLINFGKLLKESLLDFLTLLNVSS